MCRKYNSLLSSRMRRGGNNRNSRHNPTGSGIFVFLLLGTGRNTPWATSELLPPLGGQRPASSLGSADPLRNTRATNTCHRTPAGVLIERGHHGRQCISRCFGARRRPPAAAEATHALHPGTDGRDLPPAHRRRVPSANLPREGHADRGRRQALGQTGSRRVRRSVHPGPRTWIRVAG